MHWTRANSGVRWSWGRGSGKRGLADAGVVLDQHVAVGDQRHEDVAKHLLGHLHRAADALGQGRAQGGDGPDVSHGAGRHLPYVRHGSLPRHIFDT